MKTKEILPKWLLFYYPIRYYACAFIFAYILFINIDSIRALEDQTLVAMLHFFGVSSYYANENLFVGTAHPPPKINPPVYLQILFMVFFPTVAVTARINFKTRAKILLFGLLCFLVFIVTQFFIIVAISGLGITQSLQEFVTQTFVFFTVMPAGAVIILMLFSTFTLPRRTKIKRILKRSYLKEYTFLILTFTTSFMIIYLLNLYLKIETNSPLTAYMTLQVNISTTITLTYFLSYIIYAAKIPNWLKKSNSSNRRIIDNSFASFLIPAYNEEKTIKRCIESIDRAASKYVGKTEIIIVNDGSNDQTARIVADTLRNLKYAEGKLLSIPNSGKGFALAHGLERTSGNIIFRIDADSTVDENAIAPIMNHFLDPQVGIVSGMILPLDEKTYIQKAMSLMFIYFLYIIKRAQELVDSILVQAGAFSVFRKEALIKIGGWNTDQFGEDGEITNRMARFGYKCELELHSILYSEVPATLLELIHQRSRWSIAYYHARGRNLEIVKQLNNPRSVIFLFNMISSGMAFAHSLMWPFLLAAVITGFQDLSIYKVPLFFGIPYKLALIQSLTYIIEFTMFAYILNRYYKLRNIIYYPVTRFIGIVLSTYVKPQVMEILLSWSQRWKEYNNDAFEDLRKEVKRSVDPEQKMNEEVATQSKR